MSSTTNNMKYIIMGVSLLSLLFIGYFLLSSKNNGSNGIKGGSICKYGLDENGKCKSAPTCYGKPPVLDCKDGQTLICDDILKDFRCRLDDCESESNPFPYDFPCETSNVKCDSNKRYYCDNDECQNGGILYSNSNGICACPKSFIGDKCDCDTSKCNGGLIDSNCNKCLSCCNSNTSIEKKCNSYGDNCDQTCPPNYVYDPSETKDDKCICPRCFKEEEQDGNKVCTQLSTSECCKNGNITDGKCVCNDGWIGVKCDIPICGEDGVWDDKQKKCICYYNSDDGGGLPLAVGDNCEYTREKLCSGNGTPYIFNGVASCVCDEGFSGAHCTCNNNDKPTLNLECEGKYSVCEETNNGDGTYSGKFKNMQRNCREIFSQYGENGQSEWESKCTNVIFKDYSYPDYYAICTDNTDGGTTFNISSKQCNAKPTEDELKECKKNTDCFIPWEPNSNPDKIYTSYCLCDQTENGPVYSCKSNLANPCGNPTPDAKIFCGGGIVSCYGCGGSSFSYACQGSNLPKDCVINYNNLTTHTLKNNTKWYSDQGDGKGKNKQPIFPVVDIDGCFFNTLSDKDNTFAPQWVSIANDKTSSGAGFVKGLNDTQNPIFYPYNDPNIISYNINANISDDKKKILINETNRYPFRNNSQGEGDIKLFFDNDKNTYKNQAGCARLRDKTPFDKNKPENENDYSMCALGSDGKELGIFRQYCADSNSNIETVCDNNSYYRTDKGYCTCNKYYSKSQVNQVEYKGRYCQYNDNETCYGVGIVDNNGKCDYTKININALEDIDSIYKLNDGDYIILEYVNANVNLTSDSIVVNSINGSGKYLSYYSGDVSKLKNDINKYISQNAPQEDISSFLNINPLTINTINNNNVIILKVNKKYSDLSKTYYCSFKIVETNNYICSNVLYNGYADFDDIKNQLVDIYKKNNENFDDDLLNYSIDTLIFSKTNNMTSISPQNPFFQYQTVENPNNINLNFIFYIQMKIFPIIYNKDKDTLLFTQDYQNNMWWKIKRFKK